MASTPADFPTTGNHDGAAILDLSRNQITVLNSTGGFVWQHLQQGWSIEQITQRLAIETDTDPLIVDRGVQVFVEQLRRERLLQA